MPLENPDREINRRLVHLEMEADEVTGIKLYLSVGCYSEESRKYVLEDRTKDEDVPITLTPYLTHREIIVALDTAIQVLRRIRVL